MKVSSMMLILPTEENQNRNYLYFPLTGRKHTHIRAGAASNSGQKGLLSHKGNSKTRESLALYPLRVGNSLSLFLSYRCLFFFVYNARSTTLKGSDHYNKDQAHIQTYKTRSPHSEIQDSSRKINPNRNSDMTTNTSL